MDQIALQRWEQLLDAYFYNPAMSDEWRGKVQQLLFLDETFREEKQAVLEKYFDKFL